MSLAVLTPFGGKLHQRLKLALSGVIRERLGLPPACLHSNDGLLFRLPMMDEPPLDLFDGLTAETCRAPDPRGASRDGASSGCGFARTPARALCCRGPTRPNGRRSGFSGCGPRTCSRSRGRFPDFPIVLETVRECLDDDLDLPRLRELLEAIQSGDVRVVTRRGRDPSPFTSELIFSSRRPISTSGTSPKRGDRQSAGLGRQTTDCSSRSCAVERPDDWLDPQASAGWRTGCAITAAAAHRGRDGRAPAAAGRHDRCPSSAGRWRRSWPSSSERAGPCDRACRDARADALDPGRGARALSRGVPGGPDRRSGSARHDRPPVPADACPDRPRRSDARATRSTRSRRPSCWSSGAKKARSSGSATTGRRASRGGPSGRI